MDYMLSIPVVIYSHSSYKDALIPCISRIKKHIGENVHIYVLTEKALVLGDNVSNINYDESLNYSQRVSECLRNIDEEKILFLHEDMILYANVDIFAIEAYSELLDFSDISYIRLFRTVNTLDLPYNLDYLYVCDNWFFCIQPTLIKTKTLLNIYENFDLNIWQLEEQCQKFCSDNSIKGLFHFNNEAKRGMNHFDSSVFPFIATAIIKGKWNLSEYPKEILDIAKEFDIDLNIRGCV